MPSEFLSSPAPEGDEAIHPDLRNPTNDREAALASKTSMQVRKKRARPAAEAGDESEEETLAAAAGREYDENERKLNRALKWELFLYHRRISAHDEKIIKDIYGQDTAPTSQVWLDANNTVVTLQKNKKKAVLDGMRKLIEKHAALPENKNILDLDLDLHRPAMEKLVWPAWSPENFFSCWTWMKGVVDYDKSHPLGKFYMEWTFKSLAVFMAEYLRLEKAKPAEAAAEWTKIHSFYFDLPKKEEFKNVEKRHFYEVPFSQLNARDGKSQKDDAKRIKANHDRANIPAPPSAD